MLKYTFRMLSLIRGFLKGALLNQKTIIIIAGSRDHCEGRP
jgi:hypothetical protein